MVKMTKLKIAALSAARAFSTSVRSKAPTSLKEPFNLSTNKGLIPETSAYQKIVRLQKQWAAEDGNLVWQKKGFADSAPYALSLIGSAVGVGLSFYLVLLMSFPKK